MSRDRERYHAAVRQQREDRYEQRALRHLGGPQPYRDPNPKRITAALDLRDLYGPEVDRALGGEEPMVDQWENGELVPTREQVIRLAHLTEMPTRWFYGRDFTTTGLFVCGDLDPAAEHFASYDGKRGCRD
jgi:hypothetical protein